jgi:hypothetical protein
MVWELAKKLVALRLDIYCAFPYYNVNSKGKTNYLKSFGIEFRFLMDVYAHHKIEIGVRNELLIESKFGFFIIIASLLFLIKQVHPIFVFNY